MAHRELLVWQVMEVSSLNLRELQSTIDFNSFHFVLAIIKPLAKRFQQAVAKLYVSVMLNYFSTQANVKCPAMSGEQIQGERDGLPWRMSNVL